MLSHDEHISDINELGDKYITNEEMKRDFPSLIDAYRDIFADVEETAGNDQVETLAEWVKDQIKDNYLPPGMLSTASKATRICERAGADVSESEWLDNGV